MFKVVIFDLDGTLLNTLEDIADCTNEVMKQNDFPISELSRYNYFVGNGIEDMVRSALPESERNNDSFVKKCTLEFANIYKDGWKNKTSIYDGILDLIRIIKSKNMKIAILSNKPDNFTKETIAHFFKDTEFDAIWGKKDEFPLKPSPESALALIKKLNVKAADVLYVGDTSIDMITAESSGFTSVGVLWGFRTEKELEVSGAQYIVKHPKEIIKIIEE